MDDTQERIFKLRAMARQWDRCARKAVPGGYRDADRAPEYRAWAQACRDEARKLDTAPTAATPALNETVTFAPDYAGHWNGPAHITHHTYGDQVHRTRADAETWNAAQRAIRPTPDAAALAGRAVELAARIECRRIDRRGPYATDLEAVAAHTATLGVAALARLCNRLRRTLYAEIGIIGDSDGVCELDPVPPVALAEVWDAPVSVWQHPTDGPTHVTAMAVQPSTYLETWTGGPYGCPRDRMGAEVLARSSAAGRADVYAVFWLLAPESAYDRAEWRWVTGELTAAEAAAWSGIPLPMHKRRHTDKRTAAWLDNLINN